MLQPIVSVIVPTKNSASTLEDCLQSIKNQTYAHIELIVVDNHSTDQTPEIAKKYADKFYTRGPERSPQRNYGVSQASGTYVAIIDSDMNLSPTVIAECVGAIEDSKQAFGVVIPEESFGEGFWAQCKRLERSFYVGVPYMEAARFYRRKDYLDLGGYNESMVSGEDWDLSQRMEKSGKLEHVSAFIYHNEGHISLLKTVKKKFYYAKKFSSYSSDDANSANVARQTSVLGRYRLFFNHPRKLFKNPVVGFGMLFMKTCEFFFGGLGLILAKLR